MMFRKPSGFLFVLSTSLHRVLSACCLLAVIAFTAHAQPFTFTTFAGPVGGRGSIDGTGSVARFSYPRGVATDSAGNVYVADSANAAIRKITPAGAVTTLAGLAGVRGSADGTGSAARFTGPNGVATDSVGNVYVADYDLIRKITPAGVTTTLAGGTLGGGDGTGSAAGFYDPEGMATDSAGNVYVASGYSHTVRKVTPAGVVTTLAGSGSPGSADGTGTAATFNRPAGVATDSGGNVYVADSLNYTIRKITPAGVVTTLAGSANVAGSADGTGSAAHFYLPSGVATDSGGNIYVADTYNDTIRKITPAGVVTTLAGLGGSGYGGSIGSADGTGSAARFFNPIGVATDSSGNVYVADTENHTIRKVTPAGVVTTLAGLAGVDDLNLYDSKSGGSADGTGSAARFFDPEGVATDSGGNVYVADSGNNTIRKITPAGVVTTLAGLPLLAGSADGIGSFAHFAYPVGVATDSGGNVYVADFWNSTIRKITPAGVVTTLAGSAGLIGSTDGTGSAARFNSPMGVATDSGGNVYVADFWNSTIRKITPAGVVTTLAGSAGLIGSTDGTGSAARFQYPIGMATDNGGNVYVADYNNDTIRKITPAGVVTTLAGLGGVGSVDGTGSFASFNQPRGVATDSGGNVYVADTGNDTIRKITPAGVVTTLAGVGGSEGGGGSVGSVDGTGSFARFNQPSGVATDSAGNIYVADTFNRSIRIGRPGLPDAATIDSSTGNVGTTRQLDTAPQIATSWQWTLIRRPSASAAQLSSASIRNPVFTPDVADLFIFHLTASNGATTSITTVSLTTTPLVTCPVVTVNPATLPNGVVGTPYNQTISNTGGTSPVTFSVTTGALPDGQSLTAATGAITGTPTLAGTFNFTITATDTNGCAGSRAYSIVIAPPACPVITVNPATLPNGVVGTAYNQTISATGGTAPYAFSVTTGALPAGLSLNAATGAITGTPNPAGTFNFTITAKDTNLCPGSRAYSIVIGPPTCPVITLYPATLPDGAIGSAYSQYISPAFGTAPYTYSVTAGVLPPGLSLNAFNALTGAITGAPTLPGTFSFTMTATDTYGCSGSQAYSLTILIAFARISLGTAQSFAVLGSSTVTNTGASSIRGDVGVSPGTSVTGFSPGVVTGGTIHAGDALAAQAQIDLTTAYNTVAGMPCNLSLGGQDIGGRTLRPGVYCFPGPSLTGTLILDFQGDPNALFVFQGASMFMTAANSSVVTINASGNPCPPNVFWQVGIPFLGANSVFVGNILSISGITLGTGARLNGRALARNGDVTLDTNTVGVCPIVIIKGDANGDGAITVGDIFYLINSLFAGGPAPLGLTDVNGDGQITVGDIFYLINYLFAGGPPPV
jgi:Ice-binding-like/Putative Ig domain/Dockerin type I domain/NHL repeat